MNTSEFVRDTLGSLARKRVLDIGCGKGALAASLSSGGAHVTGLDPAPAALAEARKTAPLASFEVASAESLPFAADAFDVAVFSNALHHVPVAAMEAAIAEAHRVTKTGGILIIVEPLTTGSFDAVLKLVNDETDVRRAAQSIVRALDDDARFVRLSSLTYTRRESYTDFDAFVVRATSADPSRMNIVRRDRTAIEAAFHKHAGGDEPGRFALDHDMKADAFTVC